jgi:1-acyl-sn-glycerol-3-phosphate acyltransferase
LIIKKNRPIVVPVVINGFWRAFTKKGLSFKKRGSLLTVRFKEPLEIDYEASNEEILEQIMDAIEQSKKFMMKVPHLAEALKEQQLRRENKAAEQSGS